MLLTCTFRSLSDTANEWADRYSLKIFTVACKDCGVPLVTDIPFFNKECRGLYAEICECGNHNVPFTYRVVDLDS